MKKHSFLPLFMSIILLIISVATVSQKKTEPVYKPVSTVDQAPYNMKGVWVSYITLDMTDTEKTKDSFTKKIESIVKKTKENGFNTIFFQVRPFSDALYKSSYYPWSHILTGTQGKNPHYDPLQIMCDICHENDIKIHAWINPYRVSTNSTPDTISEDNPYFNDESLGFETDSGIYLDPSNTEAQKLITNGVEEIVRNYDVDGIQFDDYFYPENCDNVDDESYNRYKSDTKKPLSKKDWRIQNVNTLIKKVYKTIHNIDESVLFGISPQGNIENNYSLSADVKTWCKEKGYIDYICPQIYFSLDNPALGFEECLNQWLELDMHDNLSVVVGIAGYKGGTDDDEGTWLDNNDILKTQIEICKERNLNGIALYSYESFFDKDNEEEIANVVSYLTNIKED